MRVAGAPVEIAHNIIPLEFNVWSRRSQMDDELKDLFFDAIDHFPLEQRDAAQRWIEKREWSWRKLRNG
jgi:hypothetical protein